jgi:hypothetical protein
LIIQVHKLHYKGAKIFNVVVKDLLAKGMKNASNVSDIDTHDVALFKRLNTVIQKKNKNKTLNTSLPTTKPDAKYRSQ